MIALAAPLTRPLPSPSAVERFGSAAVAIRDGELRYRGVTLDDMRGAAQRGPAKDCRHAIAFRVWTEVSSSTLFQIASLIGRRDHSAAIHAILAGARARGIVASKVSDLRQKGTDPIDWTKLAYAAAGWRAQRVATLEEAAAAAGIGRGEWRHVELGRSVAAGTLLSVCRLIGFAPFDLLSVTHETPVKHDGGGA